MSEQTNSEPKFPHRYKMITMKDEVVIYDVEQSSAWIQSDATCEAIQ